MTEPWTQGVDRIREYGAAVEAVSMAVQDAISAVEAVDTAVEQAMAAATAMPTGVAPAETLRLLEVTLAAHLRQHFAIAAARLTGQGA